MFSHEVVKCSLERCWNVLAAYAGMLSHEGLEAPAIVSENTLTDIRYRFRYPRLAIDVANLSTHESH